MLAFSSHPPSGGCSAVLPSAVCEGRGGERRFAMNQKTQLQFNLGVVPDHAKLATDFDPSHPPSPVTIHKAAVETIGISCTPVQDFKAVSPSKLALAMKLAKRNARVKSAPDLKVFEDSEETDESIEEVDLEPYSLHKDLGYAPPEAIDRELGELQLELDRRIEKLHRSKGKGKRPTVGVAVRPKGRIAGGMGGGGTRYAVGGSVGPNRQMAGGAIPAVGVVDRPNTRFAGRTGVRGLGRGGRVLGVVNGPGARVAGGAKVVNNRICWEDLDENQEREQRWREERMTRNTRMMYDLSQQVRVQCPLMWPCITAPHAQ